MSSDLLPVSTVVTMTDTRADQEFLELTNPYRRELMAHCYRMLGSAHDAEDLVQETYLRAWRAYDGFEGRASLRTWLYRIATNACLSALESRSRRPLPTGLGNPSSDPADALVERSEVPWLEPIPDSVVGVEASDPASVVVSRESVRLALVAALQYLPPRQRAVLILRDVLRWRAAEVAEAVGSTTAAVNSTLQRARAQLQKAALTEESVSEPTDPEQRALLDRFAAAIEQKDVTALAEMFTSESVWEMPPFVGWYRGVRDIGELVGTHCPGAPGGMRMVPTHANGQPAFGLYLQRPDGGFEPFQLQVLEVGRSGRIRHVTAFFDLSLFPIFGLPDLLPAEQPLSV